jgi:hypothetical protein
MDDELMDLTKEQLIVEIKKLRSAIREHRDASGHDLCWHHPALWSLLPERLAPAVAVPDWPSSTESRWIGRIPWQPGPAKNTGSPPFLAARQNAYDFVAVSCALFALGGYGSRHRKTRARGHAPSWDKKVDVAVDYCSCCSNPYAGIHRRGVRPTTSRLSKILFNKYINY